MMASDNVVRAGLTPKFKDVDTLEKMLHFESRILNDFLVPPRDISSSGLALLYQPPISSFQVIKLILAKGEVYTSYPLKADSILLCISGSGNMKFLSNHKSCSRGDVFYIHPLTTVIFENVNSEIAFILFQAVGSTLSL